MQAPDPLQACEIEVYVAPLQAGSSERRRPAWTATMTRAPFSVSAAQDSSRSTSSACGGRNSPRSTSFGDDGDDLMLALAKRIVHGIEDDVVGESEGVEAAFARTGRAWCEPRGLSPSRFLGRSFNWSRRSGEEGSGPPGP